MCESATELPIALKIDYSSKSFIDLHKTFPVFTLIVKKKCTKCGVEKPLEMFFYNNSRGSFFSRCKACTATVRNKRTDRNKSKNSVLGGELAGYKWCPGCKTEVLKTLFWKSARAAEGLQDYCKECNKRQKEEQREKDPEGRTLHKRNYIREYQKKKRQNTPSFRVIENLRNRINNALKNEIKQGHSIELIGCSGEEAMDKIELAFWPGMAKANDGEIKWEIDHIVPVDSFDKSKSDWQFKCFHWSNMQPLWMDDNRKKSSRKDWTPAESIHELPERLKHFAPLQKKVVK